MKHQIDLLFATRDGARTLPAMLEALAALQPTSRPLRILAVENGSADATRQILTDWVHRLPIEILQGPGTGKVPALAGAATALEGELVVLTDDDIIPDPDWLSRLEKAADLHPEAAIFGGAIEPCPIDPPSGWYDASTDYSKDLFARTTAAAGPVKGADSIFGPNMMLRLHEAKQGLTLPMTLGPSPNINRGKRVFPLGDESEMLSRLEADGAISFFVPEARVKHMVRDFQTDLEFMLQRAQNHGRGVALRVLGDGPSLTQRARIVASSIAKVGWIGLRCALADRSVPKRQTFNSFYGFNWHIGAAKGALNGPFAPSRKRDATG